ncbi:MAG: glycerol-3-phosphate dehydrogenase [Gemmatimonadales bacterium]|jgi:glycerol-3-phosphate dehydrogenase
MPDEQELQAQTTMAAPSTQDQRAAALEVLASDTFDVLVIGGGITGAGIARDAAMRGLSVALVDASDFASGTSSRSSRLIHGGVRYLEHGQLHMVFESCRERRILATIAPHLVRSLQFIWPVYEKARIRKWKLRAGLFLYDALALGRNLGRHRMLTTQIVTALEPELRQMGLIGGASYFDAATDDVRLTLANVLAARDAGAVVVNHLTIHDLLMTSDGVCGARGVDMRTAVDVEIHARTVVNAAGPWSDAIRRMAEPQARRAVRGTRGVHVAVPRDRLRHNGALTLLSPIDGRVMFVLPAGAFSIIGTTDTEYDGRPDKVRPTTSDVTYLLRSANAFFPGAHLLASDIVAAWAGVRPLVASGDPNPDAASREHAITWTVPGLLSVTGGKLTTYRAMASEVMDTIARRLRAGHSRAATNRTPLPGGDMTSLDDELALARATVGAPDIAEHLVYAYGTRWRALWQMASVDRALADRILPELPYIAAELVWGVTHELARTLGDVLIRRTHVAFETRDHGLSVAPAAAQQLASVLEWNVDDELQAYRREVDALFGVEE